MKVSRRGCLFFATCCVACFLSLLTFSKLHNTTRNANFQLGDDVLSWPKNNSMALAENATANKEHTRSPLIVYLHVGKTGGSATKGALKIQCTANKWRRPEQKECRSEMRRYFRRTGGEGALSKQVIGYSHVDLSPKEEILKKADAFLFSVRDPISRFISWYDFIYDSMCRQKSKSGKCEYKFNEKNGEVGRGVFQCFSEGVESLAQSLTAQPLYPEQRLCWQRAWQIFTLKSPPSWIWHVNPYNYKHYADQSIRRFPKKEVYVIRTEHLWDDFTEIDSMLGGNGTGFKRQRINRGKRKLLLSRQSRTNLCCALIGELTVYDEILRRAKNIDQEGYLKSMHKVLSDCGGPMKRQVGALLNATSRNSGSHLLVWANGTGCVDA